MAEKWYIHSANSTELPASIVSALCGRYASEALDDICGSASNEAASASILNVS